jgi:hypothetical protein
VLKSGRAPFRSSAEPEVSDLDWKYAPGECGCHAAHINQKDMSPVHIPLAK